MAKKIAVILCILAISSCFPDSYAKLLGIINVCSYLDVKLLVAAIIVWALAKILEKANDIARENELTI